jgi:hypothetical protein
MNEVERLTAVVKRQHREHEALRRAVATAIVALKRDDAVAIRFVISAALEAAPCESDKKRERLAVLLSESAPAATVDSEAD